MKSKNIKSFYLEERTGQRGRNINISVGDSLSRTTRSKPPPLLAKNIADAR
jgi:hypothetical protein